MIDSAAKNKCGFELHRSYINEIKKALSTLLSYKHIWRVLLALFECS